MLPISDRFVRRTTLHDDEYRKNFRQIDRDAIEVLKSPEARKVTHLMAALYLTLIDAPSQYWEREGVLRFTGREEKGKQYTAWQQLVTLLDCGNTTAKKALDWMHERGLIGYYSGKNGAGIRIFINRAAASIGKHEGQKILRFARTPETAHPTPNSGMPFKDSFAVLETLDSIVNPRAPKNGADKEQVNKTLSDPTTLSEASPPIIQRAGREIETTTVQMSDIAVDELIIRLQSALEPCVKTAAAEAAGREVAQTRKWFEERALPKAIRVAQHETYDLLRKLGTLGERRHRSRADLEVGQATGEPAAPKAMPLTPPEITELAETCIALLETQGKKVDVTLSEISAEGGGWLLPEDAPRVREEAERLLRERIEGR